MIDHQTYSQIESLEYDVRELNDDFSDLRKDVEQYDDDHWASIEQLSAQVQALIALANRLAIRLTSSEPTSPVRR